jgi:hypothetical protein
MINPPRLLACYEGARGQFDVTAGMLSRAVAVALGHRGLLLVMSPGAGYVADRECGGALKRKRPHHRCPGRINDGSRSYGRGR